MIKQCPLPSAINLLVCPSIYLSLSDACSWEVLQWDGILIYVCWFFFLPCSNPLMNPCISNTLALSSHFTRRVIFHLSYSCIKKQCYLIYCHSFYAAQSPQSCTWPFIHTTFQSLTFTWHIIHHIIHFHNSPFILCTPWSPWAFCNYGIYGIWFYVIRFLSIVSHCKPKSHFHMR